MASPAQAGDERRATDGLVPPDRAPSIASLGDQPLPVSSLREAVPHLRRPFTPEAIKFKVQSVFKDAKGCLIIAYIDARLVGDRLNAVCPDLWRATYEPIQNTKLAWCFLTVDGVTRTDVGESPKGMSKDLVSDSLKRAAVHFGVGVSIYALPQITLWMNDGETRIERRTSGGKPSLSLTEHGHAKLRDGYRKWLEEHGEKRFGPVLDHGDVEGATVTGEEPDGFTAEKPAALDDDEATALIAEINEITKAIHALPGGEQDVPWGKVNAWRDGAAHSHDELRRLLDYLRTRHRKFEGIT